MDSKEKAKFRQKSEWKSFRSSEIAKVDYHCQLCGTFYTRARTRQLNLHHLNPEAYDNLEPTDFRVICSSCHELVELWIRKINGKKFKPPENFNKWMNLIKDFLTIEAKKKVEEITTKKDIGERGWNKF